jgi:hypothetical protein
MKMLHWIHKAQRLGDTMRFHLTTVVVLFVGAILMAIALGFSIAGAYIWLTMQLPDYQAALIVAGVLFGFGGIVIFLASRRGSSKKTPSDENVSCNGVEADLASQRIVSAALTVTMDTPIKAIVAATAMGFIVGLLRAKR